MAVHQRKIWKVFSKFCSGIQRRSFLEIRHSLFYTCRSIHMIYYYRTYFRGFLWSCFPISLLFPMSNTSNLDLIQAKVWFVQMWFFCEVYYISTPEMQMSRKLKCCREESVLGLLHLLIMHTEVIHTPPFPISLLSLSFLRYKEVGKIQIVQSGFRGCSSTHPTLICTQRLGYFW